MIVDGLDVGRLRAAAEILQGLADAGAVKDCDIVGALSLEPAGEEHYRQPMDVERLAWSLHIAADAQRILDLASR